MQFSPFGAQTIFCKTHRFWKRTYFIFTVLSLRNMACYNLHAWQKFFSVNEIASTAQKMKFSMKDFFSKCDQIRSFLRNWLHLLKKFLTENFILCAVLAISLTEKNFYLRILIDYSAIRYTGSAESPLFFKLHLNNKGVVDRCSMCKGTYLNMNVAYT